MHNGIRWTLEKPSVPQNQNYYVYEDSASASVE